MGRQLIGGVQVFKGNNYLFLGAIIYEMLTGVAPFYNKDREVLFKNIRTLNLKYYSYLSTEAVDLLQVNQFSDDIEIICP